LAKLHDVLNEIAVRSTVEFNYQQDEDGDTVADLIEEETLG
jgi:hypothetical protein